MKAALIVLPGSNCDRDARTALTKACGAPPADVWHTETSLPDGTDLVVVPGGFTFGDYLRVGAIAARSPVLRAVVEAAKAGTPVLGICNGFQILTECGLLPGALMRNAGLRFVARDVHMRIERTDTVFTSAYREGATMRVPVAHMDGNYFADEETLGRLEGEGLVAFRYVAGDDAPAGTANPNGSQRDIAGIYNERRNVLGLMPHPERAIDRLAGGADGWPMFEGLREALS